MIEQVQLYQSMRNRNFLSAEQAFRRLLRLSRDLRPRGLLIAQLVSVAIENSLLHDIRAFTLATSTLTGKDCEQLLALLGQHQRTAVDPLAEGLRMEYILARGAFNDIEFGRLLAKELGVDGSVPPGKAFNWGAEIAECNRLYSILLSLPGVSPHERVEDKRFDKALSDLKKRVDAERMRAAKTGQWKSPVLTLLLAPALGHASKATFRYEAHFAGTTALIAVKRYKLVHGRLPKTLPVALNDANVKRGPVDPYSGEPFLYEPTSGKVYSVGQNQRDDGGSNEVDTDKQPLDTVFSIGG